MRAHAIWERFKSAPPSLIFFSAPLFLSLDCTCTLPRGYMSLVFCTTPPAASLFTRVPDSRADRRAESAAHAFLMQKTKCTLAASEDQLSHYNIHDQTRIDVAI